MIFDNRALFEDRNDAACQLARALFAFRGTDPLVLAIPRGAVPMGRVIADQLDGELDVVLVRKLGSPFNPEFAIGAIDESGAFELASDSDFNSVSREYLERERSAQLARIREQRRRWSHRAAALDPAGRVAILVDDGLATGSTMAAALRFVRACGARRLVCAVPVASRQGIEKIRPLCDDVVALAVPTAFGAVSRFYREFSQVEDDEVSELLAA
jgi:predicted phosphoribosyltransferase